MISGKWLYRLMWAVLIVFVIYSLYTHFIADPQATFFLGQKTDLKRPLPVPIWLNVMYVHVFFACLAMVAGAINFSERVLRNSRKFHKVNGYVYLASVVIVDVTSGYMAPFSTGGKVNSIAFNILNIVWLAMTVIAIVKIRKKQLQAHRRWMVRSYAFCFTNLAIHLIAYAVHKHFGFPYVMGYTAGVYGAIVLLFVLAETVNRTMYKD